MLEQLYNVKWIKKRGHAVFLGFIYAVISIFLSILIFPKNPGIFGLAFLSVLLIPTFNSYLKTDEKKSLERLTFLEKHGEMVKILLFLFMGVFFAYLFLGFFFNEVTFYKYFTPQLNTIGITGLSFSKNLAFFNLLKNNLIVFVLCLFFSLFLGAGSILFLSWNASVWGIALNFFIREGLKTSHHHGIFLSTLLTYLPHLITEATAYISAAIVGGIVSKAFLDSDFKSKNFKFLIKDAFKLTTFGFILVILAAFIEVYIV